MKIQDEHVRSEIARAVEMMNEMGDMISETPEAECLMVLSVAFHRAAVELKDYIQDAVVEELTKIMDSEEEKIKFEENVMAATDMFRTWNEMKLNE